MAGGTAKPKITPQMIQDAINGPAFKGGTRLTGDEIRQIRSELKSLGIELDIELDLLATSKRGMHNYRVEINPTTREIVLTRNTIQLHPGSTKFKLHHETLHAVNAKALGREFNSLTPLQREQRVFDQMLKSPEWATYTAAERQFAVDYLHWVYGGKTHGLKPSSTNPLIGP